MDDSSLFDTSLLPPKPPVVKTNYSIFVIVLMGIIFLLSSISYMNLSRNINVDQISDPIVQDEINKTKLLCLWTMILSGIVFFVYGYMLVHNK